MCVCVCVRRRKIISLGLVTQSLDFVLGDDLASSQHLDLSGERTGWRNRNACVCSQLSFNNAQ